MDCVTCILVGMCVMCGPGIGRSEGGANAPGRPMTEAEVDQALSGLVSHFRPATRRPPSVTYSRRKSFIPDLRWTDIGIGKRESGKTAQPQNPSLFLEGSVPVPKLSQKQMDDVLFWPAIRRGLLKVKEISNNNGNDSVHKYRQSSEVLKKDLISDSVPVSPTVSKVINKLKRSRLEELLLKSIDQSKRVAVELEHIEEK